MSNKHTELCTPITQMIQSKYVETNIFQKSSNTITDNRRSENENNNKSEHDKILELTYRKCPTCISFAMFGEEKSMITLGTFCSLPSPTNFKTLGGRTPFKRIFRICVETNAGEMVILIKPGPE